MTSEPVLPEKIVLLSPTDRFAPVGAATTVRRLLSSFEDAGLDVHLLPLQTRSPAELLELVRTQNPKIVSGFNAVATGPTLSRLSAMGIVTTLTTTGTDVNVRLRSRSEAVRSTLASVDHVFVYTEEAGTLVGSWAKAHSVVPKGVVCQGPDWNIRRELRIRKGSRIALLPSSVREVKGNDVAIRGFGKLPSCLNAVLLIAGPVLERRYANYCQRVASEIPQDVISKTIAPERMRALYESADVILNTSESEGMSNSVLEAMHLGRCVLCSDIPGNRELVSDGETGVLFGSIEELTQRLRQLLLDPALRLSLGRNAQASVHRRHTARSEARHYINVYRHLIGAVS